MIKHRSKREQTLNMLFGAKIFCTVLLRLQLHGAIYRPDSFVLMLRYCASLKTIRYESASFNRIVADIWHRVIAALGDTAIRSDERNNQARKGQTQQIQG